MINIFRKLRHKLINEGKLKRYFIYAIGEILLVMIGILLALQINNWSEGQKNKKRVKIALTSLHKELVTDSLEVNVILKNVRNEVSHNQLLLKRAYGKSANLDTLVNIMRDEFSVLWVAHIKYSNSTFDNMKSNGSFEILADSMKSAISDFYTNQEYWDNVISKTNLQYQNRFDDFSKTYNLLGSKNPKMNNAYVYKSTWVDINPKHFIPLAISMIDAKNVLWKNFQEELETVLIKTRKLTEMIKPYMNE